LKAGQTCDNNKKKDFHCDPDNNHANCDFDGGDCCGSNVKGTHYQYHFCTAKQILKNGACTCKDPRYKPKGSCSRSCFVKQWAGDGNCDDQNNVCGCNWDGGDCCDKKKNYEYCTHCGCRDPNHKNKGK